MKDELIHIVDNKGIPSSYALSIKEFKDLKVDELASMVSWLVSATRRWERHE